MNTNMQNPTNKTFNVVRVTRTHSQNLFCFAEHLFANNKFHFHIPALLGFTSITLYFIQMLLASHCPQTIAGTLAIGFSFFLFRDGQIQSHSSHWKNPTEWSVNWLLSATFHRCSRRIHFCFHFMRSIIWSGYILMIDCLILKRKIATESTK